MPPEPQSPNPDFDFMLKDNQSGRRLPIPNLPKPILIALVALAVIIVIIIISSVLSGQKNSQFQPFTGALARAQETTRVTAAAQQLSLQDPQTQALAATVTAALTSDQKQLLKYLAAQKVKLKAAQLSADTDKSSDSSLQSASQNNNLDSAYVNYLRQALSRYQADVQNAQKGAGVNGRALLGSIAESTRTLLNSAPLKS